MIDTHISVSNAAIAVQVAAAQSGGDHVVITNEGSATCWLGSQYVTATLGLPLAAGATLDWASPSAAIYAIADPGTDESVTDNTNESISAGAGRVTVTTDGTVFTAGMWVTIVDGGLSEVVTVEASSVTQVVFGSLTRFPHASGVTLIEVTGSATQVHVVTGVS